MSKIEKQESDKLIVHTKTLEEANKIRNHLLHYRPHPCVYVFFANRMNDQEGFDVKVSSPWGSYPSDKFFTALEKYLKEITSSPKKVKGVKIK